MFPPGQSIRWWSGVGRGVNALPRGSLGRKPTPLQLFVESVVRRGSCKRSQSLGEQGVDRGMCGVGPWRFSGAAVSGTKAGRAPEGRRACRSVGSAWGLLPAYSGGTRHWHIGLRKISPITGGGWPCRLPGDCPPLAGKGAGQACETSREEKPLQK